MAKSQAKTQQLGIWDEEVDAPDHDAICLWAYRNAEKIVRIAKPELFDRRWADCEIYATAIRRGIEETPGLREFIESNPRPEPKIRRKTMETVLKSYQGYRQDIEKIVGYADLLIGVSVPMVVGNWKDDDGDLPSSFKIGWSDYDSRLSENILVEAKAKIGTIGALLRQIHLYKTAFSGTVVVLSPDDKFSEIIEEHGFRFMKFDASKS